MTGLHYTLALAVEAAMLYAFGLFGYRFAGGGWSGVLLAAVFVGVAIVTWWLWAAPKAPYRLPGLPLTGLKALLFALAALALWRAGQAAAGGIFAVVAAVHLGLAVVLDRV